MNFPKNQLFCLLGPNGAGKTTTISCLTGITPVTHGDGTASIFSSFQSHFFIFTIGFVSWNRANRLVFAALIYGHSVRSAVGMSNIRRNMGVCGQVNYFS